MLWLEHSGHSRCCVWWVLGRGTKKLVESKHKGCFLRREAARIAPGGALLLILLQAESLSHTPLSLICIIKSPNHHQNYSEKWSS